MNHSENNQFNDNSYNDDISTLNEMRIIRWEILASMPFGLNKLERARYLYLELNKRLNYDSTYLLGDKKQRDIVYGREASFFSSTSNRVICKSWAELYRELLIAAGFDSKLVVIADSKGLHKWVEIDLGDYIIRADALDIFEDSIDLANSKYGFRTNGFVFLEKELSHRNIRVFNKMWLKLKIKSSNQLLYKIDNMLGYTVDGKYREDVIEEAKKYFFFPDMVKKIFGGDNQYDEKIALFCRCLEDTNSEAIDIFYYFRKIKRVCFFKGEQKQIEVLLMKKTLPNGERCYVTMVTYPGYNDTIMCRVFDDTDGNYANVFQNKEEFDEFLRNQQMKRSVSRNTR